MGEKSDIAIPALPFFLNHWPFESPQG